MKSLVNRIATRLVWLILFVYALLFERNKPGSTPEPKPRRVVAWVTVIALILQLLGPLVRRWLENLLKDRAAIQPVNPSSDPRLFASDLQVFLEDAQLALPRHAVLRRLAVSRLRAVMMRRAEAILQCCQDPTATLPVLDEDERSSLATVFASADSES